MIRWDRVSWGKPGKGKEAVQQALLLPWELVATGEVAPLCQAVAGDVVLQSPASQGEAAAGASLTSPKLQQGGEWPWPYATRGLNVVKCSLKTLFGWARWAVAQAFPLISSAEEDCTLLSHSERGRGVLAAPVSVHGPHQWGSAELPWEQRCYINLPYRFMENWQCWQGASLTGKTAVDQAWTTQLSHKVKQVNGFRLHLRNQGWKAGNRNKLLFFFFSVIR